MKFWLREIHLTIGNNQWIKTGNNKGLTIFFNTAAKTKENKKDITSINKSNITIVNLSDTTINNIEKGQPVILNAGYKDHIGNLLSGQVENIKTYFDGLEKKTEISVVDGGISWKNISLNKSYQKNTKASYILSELSIFMGYEIGRIEPKFDIEYKLGKSISGKCSISLEQIVKDTGSKMYISKNIIYITDKNKYRENGFLLNSKSGLLKSPTKIEETDDSTSKTIIYEVECRLNHELFLDSLIQIESKTINGNFRIIEVKHSDDFISKLKVVAI